MTKIIFSLAILLTVTACGGGGSEKKISEPTTTKKDISSDPVYKAGLALISKPENDCLTCHKVDERIQGPSYREVANKYKDYPDTIVTHLANKVIKGGSGVWGTLQMTPHYHLSQEDAEKIVKYILLLNTE